MICPLSDESRRRALEQLEKGADTQARVGAVVQTLCMIALDAAADLEEAGMHEEARDWRAAAVAVNGVAERYYEGGASTGGLVAKLAQGEGGADGE